MRIIEQITIDPLQQQTLRLPDGTSIDLTLYFRPMQQGWFINSLVYGDFILSGIRLTNNPNILMQWKNKLPFGLGCFSKSIREPSLQEDFASGYSTLYILSEEEVEGYSEYLSE